MRHARGFTLIEVMVTVAIVAILASIALPQYNDYVRRSKISEATANLLGLKTRFEQYFQDNRSYCAAGGCPTCGANLASVSSKYFTMSATCPTASTFTITATGGTASDTSMAGIAFTFNEAGTKATTVSSGSTMAEAGYGANAGCWVSKQGGVC